MRRLPRRHKYGAKPVEVDGIRFASTSEANFYKGLQLQKAAGEIVEIVLQPRFLLQEGFKKNGVTYRPIHYVGDFLVTYRNGTEALYDVKGFLNQVFSLKRKLFEYKYKDLHIREV